MKKYLLITLAIVVLLIITAGVVAFMARTQTPVPSDTTNTFPVASTSATGQGGAGSMIVAGENGAITTTNFIQNGTTAQDVQNPGTYYLSGSVGYCNADGTCPSGAPSDDYHIVYFADQQSFIVSILREPLGANRLKAENFLMDTLSISKQEMCDLKYSVLTTSHVNATYGGENLGFSFCPGAVKLP